MLEGYLARGRGALGPLGCPTSDEYPWGDGARQNFQGGVLEWHPGFSGAIAISGRTPTLEQCAPNSGPPSGGEISNESQSEAIQTIDCLAYGGSKIDRAVLSALGAAATGMLDELGARQISVASYERSGRIVVSYVRYQNGLGDAALQVPARDARFLAKFAGRAFLVVDTAQSAVSNYYKYEGQAWRPVKTLLRTAAMAVGAGVGLAVGVAAAPVCATGIGCVVIGGVIRAVGTASGTALGGVAGDLAVELVFDEPADVCRIGFIPVDPSWCSTGSPA